jgi:hypothetical protein
VGVGQNAAAAIVEVPTSTVKSSAGNAAKRTIGSAEKAAVQGIEQAAIQTVERGAARGVAGRVIGVFGRGLQTIWGGIVAGLRSSAVSFTGIAGGVAATEYFGSKLTEQFSKIYSQPIQRQEESAESTAETAKATLGNVRNAKSGIGSLQDSALIEQEGQVSKYNDRIAEAQKEVDKAKAKNEGNVEQTLRGWLPFGAGKKKTDAQGDTIPYALSGIELLTGQKASYTDLKSKEQALQSLKQEQAMAAKGQAVIQQEWDKAHPGATATERAAADLRKDGFGARSAAVESTVASLRVQEKYAPSAEARYGFKAQADKLEDTRKEAVVSRQLMTQFGVEGMKGEQQQKAAALVGDIARAQVSSERTMLNADQMGTPEASSMARVGGSAGWAGLVGGPGAQDLSKIGGDMQAIQAKFDLLLKMMGDAKNNADAVIRNQR